MWGSFDEMAVRKCEVKEEVENGTRKQSQETEKFRDGRKEQRVGESTRV